MADDNEAVAALAAQYGLAYEKMLVIVTTNIDFLTGSIDDPDSFDAQGRPSTDPDHGALGYYPVTFAPGPTVYIACQRRLAATAAGSVDMAALDTLLTAQVDLATTARSGSEAARAGAEAARDVAQTAAVAIEEIGPQVAALDARTSGIASDGIDSFAHLPEGRVRIFAPFKGALSRALAFFDPDLNWVMSGARLFFGGRMRFGDHVVTSRSSDYPVQVVAQDGQSLLLMDRALRWLMSHLRVYGDLEVDGRASIGTFAPALLEFGDVEATGAEKSWPWSLTDDAGNAFAGVRDDDFHLMHVGGSVRLRMLFTDAANQARARGIMETPHNLAVAALDTVRSLIMLYGQSLGTADEGWPAITKTARHPMAYMIGSSVRPRTYNTAAWQQIGTAALNPLIATVEAQTNSSRAPLADATVAALSPGNGAQGESVVVGATNHIAKAWTGRGDAAARKFIAVCTAVSGQTIEQLSKGASPNLYQRNVDAVTLHQSLATTAGETANVAAYLFMQGEYNYASGFGGTTDKDAYKALLVAHRADIDGDIAAITAQANPPAFFIYVTSGGYVVDATHASISMAQVEFAQENPGVFCVGPTYPVTDKNGHLDPNGYRWFSAQMAKVMQRVLIDRMGWEPLYPRLIEVIGKTVYVHFHVPAGPLQFQPFYNSSTATSFDDAGFRVEDSAGFAGIDGVEIIGSSIVAITCTRAIDAGTGFVWYADKTLHNGGGNLCDSDPARSDDLYEYSTGTGMYAAANVAELVGRPYPLFNWCPPFRLAADYSRP